MLRPSSDADSDVLADYVLALIRADTPEPELRANAIENLEDFLKERSSIFFLLKFCCCVNWVLTIDYRHNSLC